MAVGPGRVVDLSVPLDECTQVYPGDPVVRTGSAATIAEDGFHLLHVAMGSQSGTHVDAPFHVLEGGRRIDEVPLARFLCPLVRADLRYLPARAPVTWEHLAPVHDRLAPGVALVLHTGWSRHRGGPAYFDHPFLAEDAARRVLALGVRTLGLDAPSIDETVLDGPLALPAHRLVAAAEGVVVENLSGLEAVRDLVGPWLSVLPLRLTGADGAPCRAVAFEPG